MVSARYTAQRRKSTTRTINPISHRVDYFGHKFVMYEVTHFDGHSQFLGARMTKEVLYLRWNEHFLRAYFETLMTLLQS